MARKKEPKRRGVVMPDKMWKELEEIKVSTGRTSRSSIVREGVRMVIKKYKVTG